MDAELPGLIDNERALSVSDFTRRVKELLEMGLRPGWVRGEVSNVRHQASGHVYFSLKDAGAQVAAVLFRGDAIRQTVALREGMQVVVYGEISVYEARGQYQLVVRVVLEDGVGKLQREFEALKKRLAEEGLFDPARKVPIPTMPSIIGFVTSPTGAAVQDFVRILLRRGWRGRLVVLPARVQGTGASAEMAGMLREAWALGIFDLIVIGRGGGSLEDLWAFNEEVLVRAIAECPVPIVSAVGHEIDFTLSDFAADLRAETPSAAAEFISSSFVEAAGRIERANDVLEMRVAGAVEGLRERVGHLSSRLRLLSPAAQIERGHLRLDDLSNRLAGSLREAFQSKRQGYENLAAGLARRSPEARVQWESHRLLSLWKRLQAASPSAALRRGFVILRDEMGRPVQRKASTHPDQNLEAEFGDGRIGVRVEVAGDQRESNAQRTE